MKLFTYILCNVFRDRSMYMQKKTGSFKEDFSKNAYYRFFRNAHANWLRFTTLLSEKIINGHLRDLTSEDRVDCFVVDDSLYERIGYKKTELASQVFDHVSMKFKKGFRMMTLGWTDGCSFIPINLFSPGFFQGGKYPWKDREIRQALSCRKATGHGSK